ncbi:DnaD domain protein [Neobacillus sp. WH10]|uniref:DnaD domain-containing protein n=1 Tax=Neobacillus sp. WH10 TaxID=3047873 RepID=UPI0024C1659C|nr:DnaD domain protein [Neobacillus sp. WH10]WHY76094.1 DnaD domain protein [Neobacillus sp. WH10]
MSIFRIQKISNYVVMNKTSLQDKKLSWKAKGLHAYMLSMPNDWKFYDIELEKHAKDGKDALKTALKELKLNGYMKRERRRNEEGKFEWETLVFEQPYTENPLVENPLMENPQLLNNDNTKYLNNVVVSPFDFYQQNFGVLNPFIAQSIGEWVDDLNEELVIEAMEITLKSQKNWKYCEGILKDWHKKNITSLDDVQALDRQFKKPPSKGIDWEGFDLD